MKNFMENLANKAEMINTEHISKGIRKKFLVFKFDFCEKKLKQIYNATKK